MKKFVFFIFVVCMYTPSFANICNGQSVINNNNELLTYDATLHKLETSVSCNKTNQGNWMVGCDGKIYECENNKWEIIKENIRSCYTGWANASDRNKPANTISNPTDEGYIYFFNPNPNVLKKSICEYTTDLCNTDYDKCIMDGRIPTTCQICGPIANKAPIKKCIYVRDGGTNLTDINFSYDGFKTTEYKNKNIATITPKGCYEINWDSANNGNITISRRNYSPVTKTVKELLAADTDSIQLFSNPSNNSASTQGRNGTTETTTEQTNEKELNITGNLESECTKSGGRGYDPAYGCICDTENDHLVQDTRTYNKIEYSICRCIAGYKRNNENNTTSGECIPTNDYETKQVPNTEKYRQDAENAYRNEYDNAQSWANKGTTALSTLMTGEGAMMAARAIAEKIADDDAEREMAEYVSTMKCEYGGGQSVNLGDTETLPGGNEMFSYKTEFKQLADKLKETKTALNLRPGIESEVLYDRAETGLYQYANAERQSGGFTSLSRALMNPEGADAEQWNAQKAEVAQNLQTGTLLTAGGLVVGAAGNYLVNRNHEPTKLQQSIDKVVVEVEEKLPAFTYTPAPVNITYQEPKTEIYLGENGGRAQIPTLTELKPKQNALTLNGDTTFDRNKATLKDTTKIDAFVERLNTEVLATMTTDQEISINIIGHTDRTGNDKINNPLSLKRAQSVEKYIKGRISSPDSSKQIHYKSIGVGSKECSTSYCDGNNDCELCRKVVVTIEDITKTQE